MVVFLSPKVAAHDFDLTRANRGSGVFWGPTESEDVSRLATRREAASTLEELHESGEIEPRRSANKHVNVGLQDGEIDHFHFMTRCRFLEEFVEE